MGKMVRSTPPPHGSHGSHTHVAPRHQSVGGGGGGGSYHGANYDGDGRGVHSAHPNAGAAHHSYHQGGAHQPFQPSQGRGGSSSGPYGYGGHGGQGRAQGQGGSSAYNNKIAAQQSESRLNGDERGKVNRESPYESKGSHQPSSHQHTPLVNPTQREHPKEQRKGYAGMFFYLSLLRNKINPVSLLVSVTACHQIGPGLSPTPGKDFSQLIQKKKKNSLLRTTT